jgi:hypothetical protein
MLDQMRWPYFKGCPQFAGLLFTCFTIIIMTTKTRHKTIPNVINLLEVEYFKTLCPVYISL